MPTVFEKILPKIYNAKFAELFEVTPSTGSKYSIYGFWKNENTPQDINGVTVWNDSPKVQFTTSQVINQAEGSAVKRIKTGETFYILNLGVDIEGETLHTLSRKQPL